jgi:hypothetical protein
MTDYVISEECLKRTCLCTICCIADDLCDEIRMNTLTEHDKQIRRDEQKNMARYLIAWRNICAKDYDIHTMWEQEHLLLQSCCDGKEKLFEDDIE